MKLPGSNISTSSAGMLSEASFGIGDMGLIFEILRSKMYKNPILAIAREITCNARDAHREVGKPSLPIEIQLPNGFMPEYRVKDFGPGITPERMENVFIKYASSTKRDDNTQTGGFGLGAKTPFSYADTFTIISVTDKIKRIYTAYIDESKVGKIALSSEQKCNEENGTTIVIPVSRNDMAEFISQTITATKYWKVKPILTGVNPTPKYPSETVLFSGPEWEIVETDNYQNKIPYAIIDGIPYKIEQDSIGQSAHKYLLNYALRLSFGIGDLSLSASRDSIHYDDKTNILIRKKLARISDEIAQYIEKKIQGATTYLDACDSYVKIAKEMGMSQFTNILKGIKWNGREIITSINVNHIGQWAKLGTYQFNSDKGSFRYRHYKDTFDFSNKTKIYHNDRTNEIVSKDILKHLFSINPTVEFIQILSTPQIPTSEVYKKLVEDKKAPTVTYDFDLIDLVFIEKLSSVNIPVKARKTRSKSQGPSKVSAYKIEATYGGKLKTKLLEMDNLGGIYLEVNANKVYYSGNIIINRASDFKSMSKFIGKPIYGFTEKRVKKLTAEWIKLETALENKLKEVLGNTSLTQLEEDILASNWLSEYHFPNVNNSEAKQILAGIKDVGSPITLYLKESARVDSNLEKNRELIATLAPQKKLNFPVVDRYHIVDDQVDNTKLRQLLTVVKTTYPLFEFCIDHIYSGSNSFKTDFSNVIDYINLVDERMAHEKLLISTAQAQGA